MDVLKIEITRPADLKAGNAAGERRLVSPHRGRLAVDPPVAAGDHRQEAARSPAVRASAPTWSIDHDRRMAPARLTAVHTWA